MLRINLSRRMRARIKAIGPCSGSTLGIAHMRYATQVREWLLDRERIRLSRSKRVPSEQDVQDVLALLEWREHAHYLSSEHAARMGASILLAWKWSNKSV